jgi:hypothetical protein
MKKIFLNILFLFCSILSFGNEPFFAQIRGSEKVATCSIWLPYRLSLNYGYLTSASWSVYCDGDGYDNFSVRGPSSIYLNTPTNECTITIDCDFTYLYGGDPIQGYISLDVQVKYPSFNCSRSPGLDGSNPGLYNVMPIHFNIDDDDRTAHNNTLNLGWDYLQDEMLVYDDDLNHVILTSQESDLDVSHCQFTFLGDLSLKAWRSPKKGAIDSAESFNWISTGDYSAHVFIEGVELGNGQVEILYVGDHVKTLRYKCFAVTYGRQPMITEHRPGYNTLTGCEWSIIDTNNNSIKTKYNSLSYVVDPSQNFAYGIPFYVEKTKPLCPDVYTLVYTNGLNKTSVDTFNDRDGNYANSDAIAFFEYQPIWPDNFLGVDGTISDFDMVFLSSFFASRAATPAMKSGIRDNWNLFHSKYNQAEIILHRLSQIGKGSLVKGFIFCPSLYNND